MEFSRPEYWSGQPFPSTVDLPNPGVEPRSPALQADSLPAEPPGKPKNTKNTGVGSVSLLQQIFPVQEPNWGLLQCRRILYQLSCQGRPWEYIRSSHCLPCYVFCQKLKETAHFNSWREFFFTFPEKQTIHEVTNSCTWLSTKWTTTKRQTRPMDRCSNGDRALEKELGDQLCSLILMWPHIQSSWSHLTVKEFALVFHFIAIPDLFFPSNSAKHKTAMLNGYNLLWGWDMYCMCPKKGKNRGDQEDLMDERALIWVLKNDEVWISSR